MTKGFQQFPVTEKFLPSHGYLLENDKNALSLNSDTKFPESPLTGMLCFRTDLKKLFIYEGIGWRELINLDNMPILRNDKMFTNGLTSPNINTNTVEFDGQGDNMAIKYDEGTIGINVMGTQLSVFPSKVQINNKRLTGLANPLIANDAATKSYVDVMTEPFAERDEIVGALKELVDGDVGETPVGTLSEELKELKETVASLQSEGLPNHNQSGSVEWDAIPNKPNFGKLATKDRIAYSEIQGRPKLGALASMDKLSYFSLSDAPTLGTLASKNSISFKELTDVPKTITGTVDWSQITNKPDLNEGGSSIPQKGFRGALCGYERSEKLRGQDVLIDKNSKDTLVWSGEGALKITFVPADELDCAVKVLYLRAIGETVLTTENAKWSYDKPAWGGKNSSLVVVCHFIGGEVILTITYNSELFI